MSYGPEYQRLSTIVLSEEPYCVGFPLGVHDGERVRTQEADHKTPLIAGGATTRANLQGLCRSCNRRKGASERVRSWRSR